MNVGDSIYLCKGTQFHKTIIEGKILKTTAKTITAVFDEKKVINKKKFIDFFSGITFGSVCKYALTLEGADACATECSNRSSDYFFREMQQAKKNMYSAIAARNAPPRIIEFGDRG